MAAESDDVAFSVVRRGYDRTQVEEKLNRLTAELDAAGSSRNAAIDDVRTLTRQRDAARSETQAARAANQEARTELERLRAQVAELSIIPHTVDGMSERLQQMVRIAQDEVNDMRSRATTSASQVLTMAQAEADELRERSANERREFEAERRAAEESLRAQLDESQTRLDQLRHDSDGQMARLDAELAERRTRAEQGLGAEMDERRMAMRNELQTLEARHREEAARILEAANADARTRLADATSEAQRIRAESRADVTEAQRELEDLRVLQHQISEQLTSVRALLDWTLPQIAPSASRDADKDRPKPQSADGPVQVPAQARQRPAPQAEQQQQQPAEPVDDGDLNGPTPRTEAVPIVEPVAANGNGNGSAAERPTPVARHSRMSAPMGRR